MRIPAEIGGSFLTYDRPPPNDESEIAFFRSTNDLTSLDDSINTTGLHALRMSAGASLSSTAQVERIVSNMGPNVPVVAILNTRQESHAKVGNYAVTLRGQRDLLNRHMSHDEVKQAEAQLIADLKRKEKIELFDSNHLKKGATQPRSVTLDRPQIMSERELVESVERARYHRLGTTDHCRPGRQDVDSFLELVRTLPEGAGIHIHCKGGRGRTTTYAIMYDMLANARDVSASDIIERQSVLGHHYQMLNPNSARFKVALQQDRMEFLLSFYEYAKQNPGGKPLLWSEWRLTANQET